MRAPKERFDFIQGFLKRVFDDDLHAKRILSLANGTLGVMTGAALAVSLVGQALATARGLVAKSAIKQVDRLLSNAGVAPWHLFGSWIAEVVGERREIVVAMDWTDFDRDNQCTLALHLVTNHGRATPLLWLAKWTMLVINGLRQPPRASLRASSSSWLTLRSLASASLGLLISAAGLALSGTPQSTMATCRQ
jgi:hypothetical protein